VSENQQRFRTLVSISGLLLAGIIAACTTQGIFKFAGVTVHKPQTQRIQEGEYNKGKKLVLEPDSQAETHQIIDIVCWAKSLSLLARKKTTK
jgi:hypothetical protein